MLPFWHVVTPDNSFEYTIMLQALLAVLPSGKGSFAG
jgi:hypothetical protein